MNFDLNISNYKISDLEEMFGLQENYDANNIEYNMNKLKTSINNNKNIDKESNEKINNFLITAANILINRNTISEKTKQQLQADLEKDTADWKAIMGENTNKSTPPLTEEEQKILDQYASGYGGRRRRSRKHRASHKKRRSHRRKSRGGRRHKKTKRHRRR